MTGGSYNHCTGPCNNGKRLCPCPEACRSEEDEPLCDEMAGKRAGVALLCFSAALMLGLIAWIAS